MSGPDQSPPLDLPGYQVHDDRMRGLLHDPKITGYLFAVAAALARLVDFTDDTDQWKIATILRWVFPCPPDTHGPHHQIAAMRRLTLVLHSDLTDPATGEANPDAALPRHFPELDWPKFRAMLPALQPATVAPLRELTVNNTTAGTGLTVITGAATITAAGPRPPLRLITEGDPRP